MIWISKEFTSWADTIQETPESEIPRQVKNTISLLIEDLDTFIENIEPARNYADFERIKNEINEFLMKIFINMLQDKDPHFILWFEQWNTSKYITKSDKDKIELINLLVVKNKFYTEILLKIISSGKLNALFTPEEKQDALSMIESGVFSFLDEIYQEWYKEVYVEENAGIKSKQLSYGWVKDGGVVALRDLSKDTIEVDDEIISQIYNPHLKNYLLFFSKAIKNGMIDYNTWVENETHEVHSWKQRESIFWVIGPMEDYIYPWVLVEPEIMVYLRNKEKKVHFEDFYGLSQEFFQDRFGMDHMTLDFVETFLQSGRSAFSGFIGKAFPNDIELSKKEWNCIILKDTAMKTVIHNSEKWLKALLGDDFEMNFETLYNELVKEVTYHEFWHSLFIKWHPTSLLEEAKATLFYYLKVYKENLEKPYQEEDIKKIIEFTLMDSIRNIERIHQASMKKYIILTKIVLASLFRSELVSWEWKNLRIDANQENFDFFLNELKSMLFAIQRIYTFEGEILESLEDKVLSKVNSTVWEHIWKITKILRIASLENELWIKYS